MMYTIMIAISTILPTMNHPLSMGIMLIIQTIMIAITTGLMINMFWFSYILIITMLSGVLVLFIYMASIASNEKFTPSIKTMLNTTTMLLITIPILILMDQLEMKKMWSISMVGIDNEQVMSLVKMFNFHNSLITLMIISYLFLTMIAISYIVSVFEGPLRTKN